MSWFFGFTPLPTQLLDLLEIPHLMDTCVRNGLNDEALDLSDYISTLVKRHKLTTVYFMQCRAAQINIVECNAVQCNAYNLINTTRAYCVRFLHTL